MTYPVLIRTGEKLIPMGEDFVSIWKARHLGDDIWSYSENLRKPQTRLEWVIDGDGLVRRVETLGFLREWTRPLQGWFWNFVRIKCRILPGERLKISELFPLLKGAKAGSLRKFLSQLPPQAEFTRSMFREFMNEPPDDQ